MSIQGLETEELSASLPKIWKLICLVASESANKEEIIKKAVQRIQKQKLNSKDSDIVLEARKAVVESSAQANLTEFSSRLGYKVGDLSTEVFYHSFVHLRSIGEIANLLKKDYETIGRNLRVAILSLRKGGNLPV